jgi:hypothetical protein
MLRFLRLSVLCFVLLLGCKTSDPGPCRLTATPRFQNITYDSNGRINSLTTNTTDKNGKTTEIVCTFSFDNNGKLTRTTFSPKGQPETYETYTYAGDRITQINLFPDVVSTRSVPYTLTYDANGRLTLVRRSGTVWAAMEYFTDNVLTSFFVSLETVSYRHQTWPKGSAKSTDRLLLQQGLPPFLTIINAPLRLTEGGEGTLIETWQIESGDVVNRDFETVTAVKTNAEGYLIERTLSNGTGTKLKTETSTYSGCN